MSKRRKVEDKDGDISSVWTTTDRQPDQESSSSDDSEKEEGETVDPQCANVRCAFLVYQIEMMLLLLEETDEDHRTEINISVRIEEDPEDPENLDIEGSDTESCSDDHDHEVDAVDDESDDSEYEEIPFPSAG